MAARSKVEFKIDQALHGYRQGHKLLSSSTRFEPRSEALLLALTDLLTSTPLGSKDSYLSGYPLKGENKYILARTWAAPESSRPGSVWTHSLILDYVGLAVIEDLSVLLSLFRRPQSDGEKYYEKAITATAFADAHPVELNYGSRTRANHSLREIYRAGSLTDLDLPVGLRHEDEGLAISLWRQMWPRLRRDFAFFTCVTGDIKDIHTSCILKFRTDPPPLQVASDLEPSTAYAALLEDIEEPGPTPLRQFLARYAHDAEDPRGVVPALVDLYKSGQDPSLLVSTFSNLSSDLWSMPRLKRDILVRAMESKEPSAVLRVLHLFKNEPLFSSETEFTNLLSVTRSRKSEWLGQLFEAAMPSGIGELGYTIFEAVSRTVDAETLARVRTSEFAKERLIEINPEVVRYGQFWPVDKLDRERLLEIALQSGAKPEWVVEGLGRQLSEPEICLLIDRSYTGSERMVSDLLEASDPKTTGYVLRALSQRPRLLERIARIGVTIPAALVEAFATGLLEQGTQDSLAPEKWNELIPERGAGVQPSLRIHVLTCGYLAAIKAHLPLAGTLARKTFDSVYIAADRYQLPRICRTALERETNSKEWKLTAKLIDSTVNIFGGPKNVDVGILAVSSEQLILLEIFRQIQQQAGRESLTKLLTRSKQSRVSRSKGVTWLRGFLETKKSSWFF